MSALVLTLSPIREGIRFNYHFQCGKFSPNFGLEFFNEMYRFLSLAFQRFSIDPKNPIGYLITVILQYIIWGYEHFIIACTLSLGIGAFWLTVSITRELQNILHTINNEAQANQKPTNELKILFSEYISAHAAIKRLSENFRILQL